MTMMNLKTMPITMIQEEDDMEDKRLEDPMFTLLDDVGIQKGNANTD